MEFRLGCLLSGYYVSEEKDKRGHVEGVVLNYQEKLPTDDVVLCLGPQARSHLSTHFQTIFPQLSAQGYSVDLPDMDPKHDYERHVKIGDRGYAYAVLQPGKQRVVAFMDFGCHDEAFIDEVRA